MSAIFDILIHKYATLKSVSKCQKIALNEDFWAQLKIAY